MTATETLISGNRTFAAEFAAGDLPIMPRTGVVLITCLDPRVDPGVIFGLELGDAAVIRNVGGRVTPDVLAQLSILRVLAAHVGAGERPNIVVVHHTDCGTSRFADAELAAEAAAAAGVDPETIDGLVVTNPATTVTRDVATLRKALPPSATIIGMVYDVTSGAARVTWRSG